MLTVHHRQGLFGIAVLLVVSWASGVFGAATSATLRGRVTYQERPVSGAEVLLKRPYQDRARERTQFSKLVARTETDVNGEFSFPVQQVKRFDVVSVLKGELGFFNSQQPPSGVAMKIVLNPIRQFCGKVRCVSKPAMVHQTELSLEGAGARAFLTHQPQPLVVGADGSFVFHIDEPKWYRYACILTARAGSQHGGLGPIWGGIRWKPSDFSKAAAENVVIEIVPLVSGKITIIDQNKRPLAGQGVGLDGDYRLGGRVELGWSPFDNSATTTGPNGDAEFSRLFPGPHILWISGNMYNGVMKIEIPAGKKPFHLKQSIHSVYAEEWHGVVSDETGAPLEDVLVQLVYFIGGGMASWTRKAATDAKGQYRVTHLPVRPWQINLVKPGYFAQRYSCSNDGSFSPGRYDYQLRRKPAGGAAAEALELTPAEKHGQQCVEQMTNYSKWLEEIKSKQRKATK